MLSIPFGVAPTADGGFLIVDVANLRIRKVSAAGVITTVAGTGVAGSTGDGGPATAAQIYNPHNVVEQADGGFLIAEPTAHRVRRVAPDGTIAPFAGNGVGSGTEGGFDGDGGGAASARLNHPKAVATTASGAVLIADEQNNRIRFVGTIVAPANTASPIVTGTAEEGRTLTAGPGAWSGTGPGFTYQWRRCNSAGGACVDVGGECEFVCVDGCGCRVDVAGPGDGFECCGLFHCRLRRNCAGRGLEPASGESDAADDFGDGAGGSDADGLVGVVVWEPADQLRVSVAAL